MQLAENIEELIRKRVWADLIAADSPFADAKALFNAPMLAELATRLG